MKIAFAVIFIIALAHHSVASDGADAGKKIKKPSPHGVSGSCQVCHLETEESLNSWFTFGSTKRKLILDQNALCRQCHGVDFGHGVGKIPESNIEDLPLDEEGKIACSFTCHMMHIKADDPTQNRYHLRLKVPNLCLSCHQK